jgi:hypothetical protein
MMEEASGGKFPDFDAKAIRKEVMLLGDVCKTAVKEELKGKYFAVTTDHWTSNNNESYACLTAHYIENGEMKRCVLAFDVFHGTTVGERLGEDFIEKFESFGFDLKYVIAVVMDTTGNMNTFGEHLARKGVVHLYCVDHNLQRTALLAYKDENLPNSQNAMSHARELVGYFTKSTQAMEKILCKHNEAITGVPLTEAILPGIYDMDIDEEIDIG